MPKLRIKAGVSRQVKFSQLEPHGQAQTAILNQPALTCRRNAAVKGQSDLLQGILYLCYAQHKQYSIAFLPYPGLGDEGKCILGEFSDTLDTEPIVATDPEPAADDGQLWETLGQEGVAQQGFINDIQELLNRK